LEGFLAFVDLPKWMNHPIWNASASHKIEQLSRAQTLGFIVPRTLVTQNADAMRDFWRMNHGKVIAKPLSTGHVRRSANEQDSIIFTNTVLATQLDDLEDLANCPTLFQEQIEKEADIRITVVDDDVHAVELIAHEQNGSQRCDIRRNDMKEVQYRPLSLPLDLVYKIRALVGHYCLRFAAIDMARTVAGEHVFFEINPNGQWAWLDLEAGTSIADSFVRAFADG
jgi:glutathione synthase/RimK-type ligase-like ATP-grasp enzyme